MSGYSREEQYNILRESAVFVNDDGYFRIDYVPEYDELLDGESIILTDEENGDECYFKFNDIDLNRSDVLTYKLVLSNPVKE